jgi:pyrroloquinoline quinone biosynthesis protein D
MPSTLPIRMPTPTARDTDRPRLAPFVRLRFDPARQRHVLLSPETVVVLNATGTAILELCDGERTVAEIVAELRSRYAHVADDDVRAYLGRLLTRGCVVVDHG